MNTKLKNLTKITIIATIWAKALAVDYTEIDLTYQGIKNLPQYQTPYVKDAIDDAYTKSVSMMQFRYEYTKKVDLVLEIIQSNAAPIEIKQEYSNYSHIFFEIDKIFHIIS